MQFIILGAVFIGIVGLLIGLFVFINRRQLAAAEEARARLQPLSEHPTARGILRDDQASTLPLLNRLLAGKSFTQELEDGLHRAGTTLRPGAFVMMVAVTTAGAGAMALLLWGALAGLIGAAVGAAVPFWWLGRAVRKRRQAFEAQLPEAIDMLVTAMRSGYSFQQAMKFIGEEMVAPLGPEFTRFYDEQRLGIDVRTALLNMMERMPSLDLKMLITAVLIQRETGGMLSEVLSNIANLMRERVAVRGQIDTLTAEPKLSAKVLAALPVVVYFGLLLVNPEYVEPLTASTTGYLILAYAAISVLVGYWILMAIADIDY